MPVDRSSFYSRAPKHAGRDATKPRKLSYVGTERRTTLRRISGDRRIEIRFDLNRPDRRTLDGRRAEDVQPKFW